MTPEETVGAIRSMLGTSGWSEVIKPALLKLRDQAILNLISPASPDKKFSDDFVKGQINALSWIITWDQRVEQLASELTIPANPEPEPVGTVLGPDGEPTSPQS